MKEIGGYLELELPQGDLSRIHPGVLVNSGRHALEYILRSLGERVRRIWLPYYTCDVVLEPIRRLNLDFAFYHINENLEIAGEPELKDGEYIIVNNYYGVKDEYIRKIVSRYGNRLIVDNAQAWYCEPELSTHSFYSPRKFFGLPDGGLVACASDKEIVLPEGRSYGRFSHLLKRIDTGASSGYEDFRSNSEQLQQEPLTKMSRLTERLLCSIDFEDAKIKRRGNFDHLYHELVESNGLTIPEIKPWMCPMVYPYLTEDETLRQRLISNKVFVAQYWPNVLKWCSEDSVEYKLVKKLVPLPIDQRYGKEDMDYIVRIIKSLK